MFEIKPLQWKRKRAGYWCAETIFGQLNVINDEPVGKKPRWFFEHFDQGDEYQFHHEVVSLKEGMKMAEEWYLKQLKPALRAA